MRHIQKFEHFQNDETNESLKPWLVAAALALSIPGKSQCASGRCDWSSKGTAYTPSWSKWQELKFDKQSKKQDEKDLKEQQDKLKNFLSLNYDRDSYPLTKSESDQLKSEFENFIKTNRGIIQDGEGFTAEQKYAMISKMLDYIKKVPQISYTTRLKKRFDLDEQSTIKDMVDIVKPMGGWQNFLNWIAMGGPEIPQEETSISYKLN
jgi:hypothetical protein